MNGKNKGEKRARKRKGRKLAIKVSNLNTVTLNSKCFFHTTFFPTFSCKRQQPEGHHLSCNYELPELQ